MSYPVNTDKDLTGAGSTEWIKFSGGLSVQVTGVATAITGTVQRSTRDPAGGAPNIAVVAPLTGNPSTGIAPEFFNEPGIAWWRVDVSALSGAGATVAITGAGA